MPRKSSPWPWMARKLWLVTIDGVRHTLGEFKGKPEKNKKGGWIVPKEIDDEFHKLMAEKGKGLPVVRGDSIDRFIQSFLDWTKENRAHKTHDRYFDFLDSFNRRYLGLKITDLTTMHVTTWLSEQSGWNSTTKRNAITALQRAFNWSVKNMGLTANPIRGMEKPQAKRRTTVVTPEDFEELLEHATPEFKDLMIVSWDSGGRPQEIKRLEARHLQLDKQRALIPAEEAKGKKHPRAIYFPTERSIEIIKRLAKKNPQGPIFRNARGNEWTGYAVKNAFERIEETTGKRFHQYAMRHSWITRKLLSGVDSHVVASLAGHQDTSMIDAVYSHVADDHKFMLAEAQKDITSSNVGRKKKKA